MHARHALDGADLRASTRAEIPAICFPFLSTAFAMGVSDLRTNVAPLGNQLTGLWR